MGPVVGGGVSGEAYGLILDTASFLFTAVLPWLARLMAGRRTIVHAIVSTGVGGSSEYSCRILRHRVLTVDTDVTVRLDRPLPRDVHHDPGDGLDLVGTKNSSALLIKGGSVLKPEIAYSVPLPVGDAPIALLPSARQGGVTPVLRDEWRSRMRWVRRISGVATGLLAVGAVLAYLGWLVTSAPDSVVSSVGAAAALLAGTPGWRASRSLKRTENWFTEPAVNS
jgi:hypothetical protein